MAQFFDPVLNRREDEWAEPSRFLLAVVRAVRAAAPDLCLGVRLSADSEPAQRMAPLLRDEVDYLSVALGESPSYLGSTLIVPPPPLGENLIVPHLAPFRVGLPLIATSRVVDPEEADSIVASGAADALGMTRALIADPDLPTKARAGQRIVRCIGCQACIAHYHAGEAIRCAINPRTGRERAQLPRTRATRPQRLVVVGAGPAGIVAAVAATAAGHKVILLERADQIGGQFALAARAPGARAVAEAFLANHAHALESVELQLGVEATADTVAALAPDAVVVATGARPYAANLPLDGATVVQAWDVLKGSAAVVGRVVVADWGGDPIGINTAETLAAAGHEVVYCVASVTVGESLHQYRRNLFLQRLYRAGVTDRPAPRAGRRGTPNTRLCATSSLPSWRPSSRPTRSCSRSGAFRRTASPRRCARRACGSRRQEIASRRAGSRRQFSRVRARHRPSSRSLRRNPDRTVKERTRRFGT